MSHAAIVRLACLTLAALAAAGLLLRTSSEVRAQALLNPPVSEINSCANGQDYLLQGVCTITLVDAAADSNPVQDGIVIVDLLAPSNAAVLGCAGPAAAPAAAPCTNVAGGQELQIPCGATAPGGAVPSATCLTVSFTIQSAIGACISGPSFGCPAQPNLSGAGATVNVSFRATPGGAGAGSTLLGTDAVAFSPPGIGTLLITATPAVIPSNGTVGTIITATFACNTENWRLTSTGFPLSSSGFPFLKSTSIPTVNQPILGTGQSAVCGAGLGGGFSFNAPRNVLFDNGRSSEGVGCGLAQNVSVFGISSPIGQYHSTAPLAFTCTGAAVMATGNGNAGQALINVTYGSSVGGLTAVGSTVVTVVPSPTPMVSVSCSPPTIAAGGPGSICTATVTDPNNVPLSGLTGATVTWTATGAGSVVVEACGTGLVNPVTPASTPPNVPQLSATLPCQTPSFSLAAQNSTFVNGQASALVVSPAGSPAGVNTISATLDVEIPPAAACLVAPYLPSPFLAGLLGQPSVGGCGTGNAVGYTGLAAAFPAVTGTLTTPETYTPFEAPSGSATVSVTAGASGLLIAGATASAPLQLTKGLGCNQVVVTSTPGTPLASLAALVSPQSSLVSIWRFSNLTKQYQSGYFSDPTAPTDFAVTGITTQGPEQGNRLINVVPPETGVQITEGYWICTAQPATVAAG